MIYFNVKRGTTLALGFQWKINQDPMDLTGSVAELHLRDKYDNLLLSASSVEGGLTINTTTAQVNLVFSADDMETVPAGKHFFDMKITLASGRCLGTDTYMLIVVKDETHG